MTDWIALYLKEDLGTGDITSEGIAGLDAPASARIVFREAGVIAGARHAADVFARTGAQAAVQIKDGIEVVAGASVLTVHGPARAILAGERVALNILARMSGIATETRRLAALLAQGGAGAVVAGTRKTTPGFRVFEKEAIRIGGGDPHRMGLYDAMMVKDNHREAAGDLAAAVRALRQAHPETLLEVEVESLEDGLIACDQRADWILIDNQDPETGRRWAGSFRERRPDVKVEASGGITPDNLVAYEWADRISMGALTHQARSLDIGLDWGDAPEGP